MADLNRDVVELAHRLPSDLGLIVGIPRSGLLAATLLALYLNVPLADLEGFLAGRTLAVGRRGVGDAPVGGRVLILDDSVDSGDAIGRARAAVAASPRKRDPVMYGAVYSSKEGREFVDIYHSVTAMPRVFQWNILHHPILERACMDIDGVLCADPSREQNDDGRRYGDFLATASPRLAPNVHVGHLVTARLEKYRGETETWLYQNGIRYKHLHMYKGTAKDRQQAGDHGVFKAGVYTKTGALLFVESDSAQARVIADTAGRPVFCTDLSEMLYPGGRAHPSAGQRLAWGYRYRARRLLGRIVKKSPTLERTLRRMAAGR